MKIQLFLIVLVFMAVSVYSLSECLREMPPDEIPCNIITSWKNGDCANYNISIYNISGDLIQNTEWENYSLFCNATFTFSTIGTYSYNSSLEIGIINVAEEDKMWLLAILLIPLGLCFFFVYLSNQMEDTHNPLKWFFRLLSLIMVFVLYQGALVIINLNSYRRPIPIY